MSVLHVEKGIALKTQFAHKSVSVSPVFQGQADTPMRREGLFMEFVSFVKNPDGTPLYENTYQYVRFFG